MLSRSPRSRRLGNVFQSGGEKPVDCPPCLPTPSGAELAAYGISLCEIVGELPPEDVARTAPRAAPAGRGGRGVMGSEDVDRQHEQRELDRIENSDEPRPTHTPHGPTTASTTGANTNAGGNPAGSLAVLAAASRQA